MDTVDSLKNVMRSHIADHISGQRGSIHDEPYKQDLFRLLVRAYQELFIADLSGEHLRESLQDLADESDTARTIVDEFCAMWDEWTYALTHHHGILLKD